MLSLALATVLLLLSTVLFLQKFKRPRNFPPGKFNPSEFVRIRQDVTQFRSKSVGGV
jgi:hypothetical protein